MKNNIISEMVVPRAVSFTLYALFLVICCGITNAFTFRQPCSAFKAKPVVHVQRWQTRFSISSLHAFNLDNVDPEENNNKSEGNSKRNDFRPPESQEEEDAAFYQQLRERMVELQMDEVAASESESAMNVKARTEDKNVKAARPGRVKGKNAFSDSSQYSDFQMPQPIAGISRPTDNGFFTYDESSGKTSGILNPEDRDQSEAFNIVKSILGFSAMSGLAFGAVFLLFGESFLHFRETPSPVLNGAVQKYKYVDPDQMLKDDFSKSDSVIFDEMLKDPNGRVADDKFDDDDNKKFIV